MTRYERQSLMKKGTKVRLKQDAWAWKAKRSSSGIIMHSSDGKMVLEPYFRYGARKGEIAIVMRKHPEYICYPDIPVFLIIIARRDGGENLVQSVPDYILEVVE